MHASRPLTMGNRALRLTQRGAEMAKYEYEYEAKKKKRRKSIHP